MKSNISIAMATYNGSKYLREQLDSVYSQSLLPYEVCVVDDCSTDDTVTILTEYQKKYGLKYVVNKQHLGVNQNFEKALLMTTGEYIMFCDQDDYWLPNKNECMMNIMQKIVQHDKACIVTCRNTYCDENLIPYRKPTPLEIHLKADTMDYRDTIINHLSQGAAMLINRKALDYILPFPKNSNICYDYYIGYIVALLGIKYDMKASLIKYRIHENNVTNAFRNVSKQKYSTFKLNRIKNKLKQYHNVSIVPEHSIRVFKLVNDKLEYKIDNKKLNYINRVILLSDKNLSFFKRLYLLCSTPKVPMIRKWHSMKAHILNYLFVNKYHNEIF